MYKIKKKCGTHLTFLYNAYAKLAVQWTKRSVGKKSEFGTSVSEPAVVRVSYPAVRKQKSA